jgi:hypothetical protein
MGAPSAQVQSPQSSSSGKGIAPSQNQEMSSGKGGSQQTPEQMQGSQGAVTFPGQGGQPQMGMPNAYSNTIDQNMTQGNGGQNGMWDNSTQPSGKGSAGTSGSSSKGKR